MRALVTAQFDSLILDRLRDSMDVNHSGWGVSERVLTEAELLDQLRDTEIFITEIERCTRGIIEKSPDLVFIGCCRNNPVNVDIQAANERRIPVIYTPGRNAQAVAEMTLAMMTMLARKMGNAMIDIKEHKWTKTSRFSYLEYKGIELEGKTVGIAGLGAIGRIVLQLCEAYKMQVIVFDPYLEKQFGHDDKNINFVTFQELITQSDFLTLHVPDTPETMGIIGENELASMKESSFLLNTARGKHVDEDALYEALKSKKIQGAALDVFYQEPLPLDHKYLNLDNILMFQKQSQIIYDQIQNYLTGKRMSYLKNPEIYLST